MESSNDNTRSHTGTWRMSAKSPSIGDISTTTSPTREGDPPTNASQQLKASGSSISNSPSDAYIPAAAASSGTSEGESRRLRACAQLSDISQTGAPIPNFLHPRTPQPSAAAELHETLEVLAEPSTPEPPVSSTASPRGPAYTDTSVTESSATSYGFSVSRESARRPSNPNPNSMGSGCAVARAPHSGSSTSPSQTTVAATSTAASESKLLFDFDLASDLLVPFAVAGDSVRPRASAQLLDTDRASVSSAGTAGSGGFSLRPTAIGKCNPQMPLVDPFAVPSSPLLLEPKEMQQLSLQSTPSTSVTTASSSSPGCSQVRLPPKAFVEFRDPSSSRSRPSSSLAVPNDAAGPSKRLRISAPPPRPKGIQPHPAYPPRWRDAPADYVSPIAYLHPWGQYVAPRRNTLHPRENEVTAALPVHVYRHIPQNGYFSSRFVRSLFPRRFDGEPSPTNPVPIMELVRFHDVVAFRQHAVQLTIALLDGDFRDDTADIRRIPWAPVGTSPASSVYPPSCGGRRPVLYQVVARGYGQGVILEAKDFFIPGPDLRELHCIPLAQDSVNILSGRRGFDVSQVSVKDLVWVFSLRPTQAVIRSHDREEVLHQARLPRASRFDVNLPYFFRAHEYTWVTPSPAARHLLGITLAINRRGEFGQVNTIHVAFQGCPEAVRISPALCDFDLNEIERDTLLFGEARSNVSCAMRFCVPPVSVMAERVLVNAVRCFMPSYPEEAMLPLRVYRPLERDLDWITDRMGDFSNYSRDPTVARRRMSKLFATASAALAAQAVLLDDKQTHEVAAFVPSINALPVRLQIELRRMSSEAGWSRGRSVDVWITNSSLVARTTIMATELNFTNQILSVELHSDPRTHRALRRAIERYGSVDVANQCAHVGVNVRLCRAVTGTDPLFEVLASENLFQNIPVRSPSVANDILNAVYGSPRRRSLIAAVPSRPVTPVSVRLGSSTIRFRPDQAQAVQLGCENRPILAIQAAYGTGKTVVGAVIAARVAAPAQLVVATATTNVAVAQFADTLLRLTEYQHLHVVRFVADSALREGAPTTPVDLHNLLQGLLTNFPDAFTPAEIEELTAYTAGRRLIEALLFHRDATLNLSDEEREEFRIAEIENSEATENAVRLMMRVRFPAILCITTSSLIKSTRPGGLFHELLSCCKVIIGDEASQIPEPAFAAMVSRFPAARQIYIGDAHQLAPHVRCPASSLAARLGARGIMDILLEKDVPLAPLVTTFRMHPALNALPNHLIYNGSLISGTQAAQRNLSVQRATLPNPNLPLVLVDVHGISRVSASQSHSNEDEARCCMDLVYALLAKGISEASLAIITYYKDQQRLLQREARHLGIALHTVDTVQGREMDIVVILTTRSDVDASSGEFLDDRRRLNVALTRCRHGLFVLGCLQALQSLPFWGRVIQWAQEHDVVVSDSTLPDILA